MIDTSFSPWPSYTIEEVDAVKRTLLSNRVNYWTGNECRHFEDEFSKWIECKHAISLANGTVALDLALKVLEISEGDEVIVTPRTYIASVSSIINIGAKPVFAEINPDSQNITAETIKKVCTSRTKAIICVHLAGWPCDMDEIVQLAKLNDIRVVEDCAQAHGARYKGRSVGGFGDVAAWSFCQDKIMTTGGEGGMLTTNCSKLWNKAWSFKDHGKSWDEVHSQNHKAGFRWVHNSFGTNFRMTEMQAAIGRIQIRRMSDWHKKRRDNALSILTTAQSLEALRVPIIPKYIEHAFYKVYFFIRPEKIKKEWTRDKIIEEINQLGVPCSQGSCPEVYLEKAFIGKNLSPLNRLASAKDLGDTCLMFLVHPTLTESEICKTNEAIRHVITKATI